MIWSWMTISFLQDFKIKTMLKLWFNTVEVYAKSLVLPIVQATCTYLFFAHLEKSAQLHAGKFIPSPQKIHFWVMMLLTRIQSSVQLLQCLLLLCTLLFCCCSFLLYPPPAISTTYTLEINSVKCLKIRDQLVSLIFKNDFLFNFWFKWTICYLIENRCCWKMFLLLIIWME